MKRIFILGLAIVLVFALLPVFQAAAADYGTVTGGWLRLRAAPSFDATIIKSYYTGTVVEILGTSGDWYSVKAPDNQAGYMHSDYISLGGSPSVLTKYVWSSNGYGVRLRSGPSTGYRVIAVYSVGTQVSVLQTGVLWSRIQVGTTVGFMMSEFLTSTDPGTSTPEPTGDDLATVWSSNGYGVRLRSGPGTSYSIIGLYSVGTRVAVQTRGTDWDYILVGSRLGYMMNEFLIYDDPDQTVATGITVTADYATGMQDETVDLDVTVTGTDLSSPAYTLEITDNASMAEIVSGQLHILSTATVGAVIEVTATTTDDDENGDPLTDSCTVTVTAAEPRVTAFSFDDTETSVSIAGGDVERRIGYSISGYNLTAPYFSLAVSAEAGGNVTTSIDTANEEIVLNISSAIADGTVFTVTGTTTADDAGGNPKTAVLTVTITTDVLTLTSIELIPEDSTLRHDETTNINARLHYSNGSYVTAAITTDYTLSITSGSTYASLGGKVLFPDEAALEGVADQTIEITGTSVEDPSLTDTCEVLLYGRNAPDAPVLTAATPAHTTVTLQWTAPANDGGEDLEYFKAYYSLTVDGAKNPLDETIDPGDTEYIATGLIDTTTYYFWVVASNTQGDSDYSNYLTATPNPDAPSAVQGLNVLSRGDGFVELGWSAPSYTGGTGVPIDHYRVYVDGVEYDSAGRTDDLSKMVTGLTNAQTYEFMVVAVNSAEIGEPDTISSNPVGTPAAPTVTQNVEGFEEIYFAWLPDADTGGSPIESYDLYFKVATDPDPVSATVADLADTEKTFSGLLNVEYEFWVVANNGISKSDPSAHVTNTPYVAPSEPQSVTASGNTTTVHVTWLEPATLGGQPITNYIVSYTSTLLYTDSVELGNVLEYDFDGLAADTYTFHVSASNDGGANYGSVGDSAATLIEP